MTITYDFSGRVLAVTGATGGIARAVVQLFADAGASVALADIDEERLQEMADSLDLDESRILTQRVDVRESSQCDSFAGRISQRFGKVDVLVPAAGVSRHLDFEDTDDESWRRTISVNLDGVFYAIRAIARLIPAGGSIVNLASMAANRGPARNSAYGASKGAIVSLTRALCRELAPRGVRVNAVAPGPIDTGMIAGSGAMTQLPDILSHMPLARLGEPEEVAAAIAFLAGDGAGFITGEILHVNGGYVMGG